MKKLFILILLIVANAASAQYVTKILISGYPSNATPTKEEFRLELHRLMDLEKIKSHIGLYCPENKNNSVKFLVEFRINNVTQTVDFNFDSVTRKVTQGNFIVTAGRGGEKPYPHAGMVFLDWEEAMMVWKNIELSIEKEPTNLMLYAKDSLIKMEKVDQNIYRWPIELQQGSHDMTWVLGEERLEWTLIVPDDELVQSARKEWEILCLYSQTKSISEQLKLFHSWFCYSQTPIKLDNLKSILKL